MGVKLNSVDHKRLGHLCYYDDKLSVVKEAGYDSVTAWMQIEMGTKQRPSTSLAKEMGVNYNTILNWARKLGLPTRRKGGRIVDHSKRFVSDTPCKINPNHVREDGTTIRYKIRPQRCVLCQIPKERRKGL